MNLEILIAVGILIVMITILSIVFNIKKFTKVADTDYNRAESKSMLNRPDHNSSLRTTDYNRGYYFLTDEIKKRDVEH